MDVDHALLWNDTADSAVDLNPNGFRFSYGLGTNGTQQVGVAQGLGTDINRSTPFPCGMEPLTARWI